MLRCFLTTHSSSPISVFCRLVAEPRRFAVTGASRAGSWPVAVNTELFVKSQ